MMIIIEGGDKTGKSTLTDYLLKNIPKAFLLKIGDRPKDGTPVQRAKIKEYYWKVLKIHQREMMDSVLILDRFFYSELAYSYKRGYEASKDPEMKEIQEELENIPYGDIIVIYCNTSDEKIAEKFVTDKEDYAKLEDIKILQDRYNQFLQNAKVPYITYDYTMTTPAQVLNKVLMFKEGLKDEH